MRKKIGATYWSGWWSSSIDAVVLAMLQSCAFLVALPSHSELLYKDMTLAVIKDEINHEKLGCCPCSQVKWEWQNNIYDSNFMLVTCNINPSLLCAQIKSEFSSSQEPSQIFVFDCQGPTILLLKYPLIIDFLLQK